MVKLPSCIQALDLQNLPCKVGVYMVRLDCGPVSLAPTSAAPQAACPPPVWACKGRGAPAATEGQLCPRALRPGLLAAWALCRGWRLAAGQPSAHSLALYRGLLACAECGVRRHRCRMGPCCYTRDVSWPCSSWQLLSL